MTTPAPSPAFAPNTKIVVAAVVGLVVVGLALYLLTNSPAGFSAPGFLGTGASLFADINLVAEIVLLLGLTVGYGLARGGRHPAHQYNQTAWVLLNIVLVMFIMMVSFRQNVAGNFSESYAMLAAGHALIGTVTMLCGIYLLLRMNGLLPKALRLKQWKTMMRITLVLYWLVGLGGLYTYYSWYIAG